MSARSHRRRLPIALSAVAALAGACARPNIVEVRSGPRHGRSELAVVVASSGEGKERIDIVDVDERRISHDFGPELIWIEVPAGEHLFQLGLAWSRTPGSPAFYSVPMRATVEAGRCYRPMLGPVVPGVDWKLRERHLEPISCPPSFPRSVRVAPPPPEPL